MNVPVTTALALRDDWARRDRAYVTIIFDLEFLKNQTDRSTGVDLVGLQPLCRTHQLDDQRVLVSKRIFKFEGNDRTRRSIVDKRLDRTLLASMVRDTVADLNSITTV